MGKGEERVWALRESFPMGAGGASSEHQAHCFGPRPVLCAVVGKSTEPEFELGLEKKNQQKPSNTKHHTPTHRKTETP